jgi:hypothetical protein
MVGRVWDLIAYELDPGWRIAIVVWVIGAAELIAR